MVVMMPMKRLTQERVTKAEEGIEKTKLAGYMRGTEDHLKYKRKKCVSFLFFGKTSGFYRVFQKEWQK